MLKERILNIITQQRYHYAFTVKNLKTGERISFQADEVAPSASLIKLCIMAAVMRKVKEGRLLLEQRITISNEDKVPFSILAFLETGNSYSLNDLLTLMIIQSDNTASNLLINMVGMAAINEICNDLNLKNTSIQRKMMDFEARKKGLENRTTAGDMAHFLELLYRGEVIDGETSRYILDTMKRQLDNSMMRIYIPDDTVIAHKTGELDGIAHEAGLVFHEAGDYIFVVLIWDADSNNIARQTIGQISKVVYDYFGG